MSAGEKAKLYGDQLLFIKNYLSFLDRPCYPEKRVFSQVKEIMAKRYSTYTIHFFITGPDSSAINNF